MFPRRRRRRARAGTIHPSKLGFRSNKWRNRSKFGSAEGRGRGAGDNATRAGPLVSGTKHQNREHALAPRAPNLANTEGDPEELESEPIYLSIYLSIYPSIHTFMGGHRDHHRAKSNPEQNGRKNR
jgi:hypothetical protein